MRGVCCRGRPISLFPILAAREAATLAPVIAALAPCRAVTSDLVRAAETARIPGISPRPQPLSCCAKSTSVCGRGGLSPSLWPQIPTPTPVGGPEPTGRTVARTGLSFAARVEQALMAELAADRAKTVLAVCHGGVIRAAMQVLLGLPPRAIIPVAPASLTAIRLDRDHKSARAGVVQFSSRTAGSGRSGLDSPLSACRCGLGPAMGGQPNLWLRPGLALCRPAKLAASGAGHALSRIVDYTLVSTNLAVHGWRQRGRP